MKRLLIYLIGNIGAGKTTLLESEQAKIVFKRFGIFNIDDHRRLYNSHGTKKGEDAAWKYLKENIRAHPLCIVECTGVSSAYKRLRADPDLATQYEQIVVWLDTSPDECLRRCNLRLRQGYKPPPLPYTFDLPDSIAHVQAQLLANTDYHVKLYGNKAPMLVLVDFVKLFLKSNPL